MRYRLKRTLSWTFFAVWLSIWMVFPSCAMVLSEDPVPVNGIEELLRWYEDASPDKTECKLGGALVINSTVVLKPTSGEKVIGVNETPICIKAGGRLVLDNPSCAVTGQGLLISVERGGVLELNSGGIYGDPSAVVVVVRSGGNLVKPDKFHLEGLIKNEGAQETESSAETDSPQESETAKPTEPGGTSHSTAIDLSGRVMSYGSTSGQAVIRLSFETLPKDTAAVYLYQSADGTHYTKMLVSDRANGRPEENFLNSDAVTTGSDGGTQYLVCRPQMNPDSFIWLKMMAVGPSREDISNVIKITNGSAGMANLENGASYYGNSGGSSRSAWGWGGGSGVTGSGSSGSGSTGLGSTGTGSGSADDENLGSTGGTGSKAKTSRTRRSNTSDSTDTDSSADGSSSDPLNQDSGEDSDGSDSGNSNKTTSYRTFAGGSGSGAVAVVQEAAGDDDLADAETTVIAEDGVSDDTTMSGKIRTGLAIFMICAVLAAIGVFLKRHEKTQQKN